MEYLVRKLGKDTLTYVPAKLIPGLITIISVAIFTRIFDPSAYGQYMLVTTTVLILVAILSQWVTQSILRYRAQYVLDGATTLFNRNLLYMLSLITLLSAVLAIALYPASKALNAFQRFYLIAVLIVVTQVWFDSLVVVFQADLKPRPFSFYTIANAILKFSLAITLFFLITKDVISLLGGMFLALLILVVPMTLQLLFSRGVKESIVVRSNTGADSFLSFSKKFLNYGLPMIGWYIGAELLSLSDRYFLQVFRNSTEVGIYSSNYNLVASAISFVSMPILTAAHPLLMKAGALVSTKKEAVQDLISVFSRYFLIIAIPVITYVILLSRELAEVFLGEAYRQGSAVLPIVLCGLFAWYFAMFGHKGLEFREKTNIMFIYVMICTAIKTILNLIFIPHYGYMAAAVATLVCFFIYPVLVYFGTKNDIRWNIPWKSFGRLIMCSVILAVFFRLIRTLPLSPFICLVVGGISMIILYPVLLYLFKEIQEQEIAFLRTRSFLGRWL